MAIISWLKKHFIPHEGNNHRPHILRGSSIRNIIIIVVLLEIVIFLAPTLTHLNTKGGMAAVLPAVLANLTNEERQSQKLNVLAVNPILNKAAEMKAIDMATKGYFAHISPEGKTPWYWLELAGYKYQYAGENLAVDFSDSKDVASAWMASPTHRMNIVKNNYTEIGTGIAIGIYEGRETIFVAQVYANPLPEIFQEEESVEAETRPSDSSGEIKKTEETSKVEIAEEAIKVLGAEATVPSGATEPVQNPTFWQKAFASPRHTANVILYIVFGIITIALLLYILVKMRNHHKDLITNGLAALAIVGAIFITNSYFSHRDMMITQSLDYSNEF